MNQAPKKQVLILCTANSCRSQMAEGIARQLYGTQIDVYSAGSKPSHVNPIAIEVMGEIGIDISHQRSNSVTEFDGKPIDLVITVCDQAKESCPLFLGSAKQVHWSFSDPADATGSEEEIKEAFRKVRDEIKSTFERLLRHLI